MANGCSRRKRAAVASHDLPSSLLSCCYEEGDAIDVCEPDSGS